MILSHRLLRVLVVVPIAVLAMVAVSPSQGRGRRACWSTNSSTTVRRFRRVMPRRSQQTPEGLVAAWFGGKDEGEPDVGIWFSRHDGTQKWSAPVEVANGVESPDEALSLLEPGAVPEARRSAVVVLQGRSQAGDGGAC